MTQPRGLYSDLSMQDLILRDRLAAHRTILANERTALAYIRTMLTFAIGGATFIHFFDARVVQVVGWAFIPISLIVGGFGVARYLSLNRLLAQVRAADRPGAPSAGG